MKKLFGFLLSFSLVLSIAFGSFTNNAQAITFDELVAQVTSLKNEILSLRKSVTSSVIDSVGTTKAVVTARTLQKGLNGTDVVALQTDLKNAGFFSEQATGYFGAVTSASVKSYQSAHGLKVTGIVDASTRTSLLNNSSVTRVADNARPQVVCMNKTVSEWAPGKYSLKYQIGIEANYLFYVEGSPSLYSYNVNDPVDKKYPYAKYTTGSTTSMLNFFYATQDNDGILSNAYNLTLNPLTKVNESLGKIYALSLDGTRYYDLAVPYYTIPKCTDPVRTLEGELTLGNCSDGILNGNEISIDNGGRCPLIVPPSITASTGSCGGVVYPDFEMTISVKFSQAVTATGTPKLKIVSTNASEGGALLNLVSGSGTDTLVFKSVTPTIYPYAAYLGNGFQFSLPLLAGVTIKNILTGMNANIAGQWPIPDTAKKCVNPNPVVVPSPSCSDGIQNQNETGIDTGGVCSPGTISNGGTSTSFAHWPRSTNPVTIGINFSADSVYNNAFNAAFADWDTSAVLDLQVSTSNAPQVKITSVYSDEGWAASTGYSPSSVLHADGTYRTHLKPTVEIRLNNKYLTNGGLGDSEAFRQYIICHSLGTALGVDYKDLNNYNLNLGTCMDYSRNPAGLAGSSNGTVSNLHPSQGDLDAIAAAHHVNPGDGSQARPSGADSAPTPVTYTIPAPN